MKNTWAMHQPTSTTATLGATATTRMPREPPVRPMTIQGRRMPSRDDVRSLILPKNGLANIERNAPGAGDERQAVRCLVDPHERVDLQGQADQQGREEEQDGAHVRRRVHRDEARPDAFCRAGGRLGLARSGSRARDRKRWAWPTPRGDCLQWNTSRSRWRPAEQTRRARAPRGLAWSRQRRNEGNASSSARDEALSAQATRWPGSAFAAERAPGSWSCGEADARLRTGRLREDDPSC